MARQRSRRDPALDIIRGLCIISMVVGHIADDSPLYWLTHQVRWVNGAVGFVLLAGLVLGMVQRRIERPSVALAMLGRRARLVWVAHVLLVLLALLVTPWNQMIPAVEPATQMGGWASAIWYSATLRVNPIDVDILSLYVVLFAVAAIAVLLLRARLLWLLLALSTAGYLGGLMDNGWASLPHVPGVGSHFNIATWQAIFVMGLIVGWYWRSDRVQQVVASRRVAFWALGITVALAVAGELVEQIGVLASLPRVESVVRDMFGDGRLGAGRILFALCLFLVLYRAFRSTRWAPFTAVVAAVCEPVGRRALGAFVILTVFDLLLPVFAPYEPASWIGMQWAVMIVVIAWFWVRMRDRAVAAAAGALREPEPTTRDAPAQARTSGELTAVMGPRPPS